MVEQPKPLQKRYSWVPLEKARAQMAKNNFYVILILEGRLYSLDVELLFDLLSGKRESLRIFRLEEHGEPL
jgi:hypothetical protein